MDLCPLRKQTRTGTGRNNDATPYWFCLRGGHEGQLVLRVAAAGALGLGAQVFSLRLWVVEQPLVRLGKP
eukprot:9451107-Alexandrium_andersonii.AAC.1